MRSQTAPCPARRAAGCVRTGPPACARARILRRHPPPVNLIERGERLVAPTQRILFFSCHSRQHAGKRCRFPAIQSHRDCCFWHTGVQSMNMSTPLSRAIRLAIGGAVGLSATLAAPVALTQQAEELGEVVITGSRIRQNPLEERLPV